MSVAPGPFAASQREGRPIAPRSTHRPLLPLTRAQQSAWFSGKLAGDTTVLHLPAAVRLEGRLDDAALRCALTEILRRHDILRTAFFDVDGRPAQRVMPPRPFDLSRVDCTSLPAGSRERQALLLAEAESRRPLDLEGGAPIRAVLYALGPEDHVLLLVVHHLVWDGWSIGLFVRELSILYDASVRGRPAELAPLALQYGDVALHEESLLASGGLAPHLAAAERELAGIGRASLPCDRPREGAQRFSGRMQFVDIPVEAGKAVTELARRLGATPFMVLFAAFSAVLHRYGPLAGAPSAPRFAVGTPLANRGRPEVAPLIGYFAHVVPLLADFTGDPSFEQAVLRARAATIAAHRRESVPFDLLVDHLGAARSADHNPLFDAMFALHAESLDALSLGGLSLRPVHLQSQVNHFDLGLHLWKRGDTFAGYLSYAEALFDAATVARLAAHLLTLLPAALASPGERVSSLPLLPAAEVAWLAERERDTALSPADRDRLAEGLGHPLSPGLPLSVRDGWGARAPVSVVGRVHVGEEPSLDMGTFRPDGRLALTGSLPGTAWSGGRRWDLRAIEASLRAVRGVASARVTARRAENGLCAIVVLAREVPRADLEKAAPGVAIVILDRLPTADVGEGAPPVVDEALRAAAEQAVSSLPGVTGARAFVSPAPLPGRRLHVTDLLTDQPRRSAEVHSTSERAAGEQATSGPPRPPAHARGAPFTLPSAAPATLIEALVRTARDHGARGITVIEHDGRETFVSYGELLERAARVRGGLRALGKGRGEHAILQVPTLAGHFVAFWGCVLAGVIPVTVAIPPSYSEPNAVLAKLRGVHDLLGGPAVIGARATLAALRDILSPRDGGPPPRVTALAIEDLESAAPDLDLFRAAPEDVMFLQLSSGSTGVPKVIQERHSALLHHVYAAAIHNEYSADDVDLSFLPLDHVVPILTCHLKDVCLGVSQIHVRTERILKDPLLWLDLLESRRATHTWSPNFGYKLVAGALAASPGRTWDLSRVRFFMNAGEQVTLPVISDFLRLTAPFGVSPRAMQPAFGMAEVCTCMTWENHFTPETGAVRIAKLSLGGALREAAPGEEAITFVGLGPPMPGVEVRIAGDTNETLPEMTIGRLQIRGAVVMPGYLRNDEANREAFPGEGWLDSGDLGFLHGGRLFVTGRKKEMILVRGANFYCHEIEDVAGRVPGVLPTFVAACAVEDPGSGTESVAVFFVPESGVCTAALLRAVRAAVTKELGVTPRLVLPLDRAGFPKTTSGKIQRTDLKKRLARGDLDDLVRRTDLLLENEHTLPPWFFRWVFRPAAAPPPAPLPPAIVLGRGPRAAALAADLGARYVAVEQGASAGQALPDGGAPAPLVVHAIGLDAADEGASLVEAAWDAVSLARPTSSGDPASAPAPRRLCFVTEGAVSTAAGELPSPARAALLGLLPSLAEEQQGLSVRLVDVDRDAASVARAADEIRCASDEPVVALRGGERLVRRLVPAITGRDPGLSTPRGAGPYPAAPPVKRGGLYLLTGGLGGVGAALAAELLVHRGARLLLTGRSPLEDEVQGDTGGLAPARTADERRRTFARLAALGPVLFAAADVTDREAMSRAVAAAESHFGRRLDGVIHLAGVFPARLAAEETRETLADTFDPKVRGALVLDALLPGDRLFVAVSSVYGAFGGAASGAYSAASSALDAVIAARRARGMSRSFSVACSLFRDLGMSRDFAHEDRAAALGYHLMDAPRAVTSLLAAAAGPAGEVLIGLAPEKVNVRRHIDGAPIPLEEITVYCTGTPEVHRVEVTDRFGARAAPRVVPVLELPSGREAGGPSARGVQGPRTPTEKVIAGLWREVLQVDPIDLDTSFFALGGQSILLVQVLERTNRHFGTRLAVVDLFRRPTVRSLADMIDSLGTRDVRESVQEKTARAGSRADRQREAARARASARPRGAR